MADPDHVELIKQGADAWNEWRRTHRGIGVDLRGADLWDLRMAGADLAGVSFRHAWIRNSDFRGANLRNADLAGAFLGMGRTMFAGADLRGADFTDSTNASRVNFVKSDLSGANLFTANLSHANLRAAKLRNARLEEANLGYANLADADLTGANLTRADLVGTNLTRANISDCCVYGIAAWDPVLTDTIQSNLIVTAPFQSTITVDNLEVAQFVYLLINNEKIRNIIDVITGKVVLILGNFSPSRKIFLDAIRDALRRRDYIPVLFDFNGPSTRDLTETITTLARLCRFIIADLTLARGVAHELASIVPDLPSVPIQPLISFEDREYVMFEHIARYPWVLPIRSYAGAEEFVRSLDVEVIEPAETKVRELRTAQVNRDRE